MAGAREVELLPEIIFCIRALDTWEYNFWYPFLTSLSYEWFDDDLHLSPIHCNGQEGEDAGAKTDKKTSQELGNCPMGQREALLKERLY